MGQVVGGVTQTSIEIVAVGEVRMMYAYAYALFDGVTSVSVDLPLPRNALVDDCKFLAQAQRIDYTKVQDVAQVRSYSDGGKHELVIDFGTPRTISGVDIYPDIGKTMPKVTGVFPWLGSQFAPDYANALDSEATSGHASFSELRTERLRVVLSRGLNDSELSKVQLRLPEPPSGLEIRIDGAAPVWSHPEPVQPRANVAQPDLDGWDKDSQRIIDLTSAVAALAGDPLGAEEAVNVRLTLSTKVPCQLTLRVHGVPKLRRIRRIKVDNDTTAELEFAREGQIDLPLHLPAVAASATRQISELRWLAVADLPPLRVLPPIGPAPAGTAAMPVLAELTLDPQRAAIVRLGSGSALAELNAIRLPLRALGDAAEARVVLWAVPEAPVPQGTSEPVTLPASETEQWVTFPFKQGVKLDRGTMPWAALVVARGALSWALGRSGEDACMDAQTLRHGAPNGPWKALPAALQSAATLLDARGRLRLQGLAPKEAPLPALKLTLVGAPAQTQAAITPSPKGTPGKLQFAALSVAQPVLRLTSYTAGSVQLREIDVISNV